MRPAGNLARRSERGGLLTRTGGPGRQWCWQTRGTSRSTPSAAGGGRPRPSLDQRGPLCPCRTIRTEEQHIDIYTPVKAMIEVPVPVETEVESE